MNGSQFRNWTLGNLLWWPFYAVVFLTFRGDGGVWRFFWMTVWSLIVICCCKQIFMLIFQPPEELKGDQWRGFRCIVGLTRLLAIVLIFTGVLWGNGEHLYSSDDLSFFHDELPPFAADYPIGYAVSLNSGHAAVSFILPLSVLLAAYPFGQIKLQTTSFLTKLAHWLALIIVALILSIALEDYLIEGALVLNAIKGIDLVAPTHLSKINSSDWIALLSDIEFYSMLSIAIVAIAASAIFAGVQRTGVQKLICLSVATVSLAIAFGLQWTARLEYFPKLSQSFGSLNEPRMISSWVLVILVVAICSWLVSQIFVQGLDGQSWNLSGKVFTKLTLPPSLLIMLSIDMGIRMTYFYNEMPGWAGIFGTLVDSWPFTMEAAEKILRWHGKETFTATNKMTAGESIWPLIYLSILVGFAFMGRTARIRPENLFEVRKVFGKSALLIWIFTPLLLLVGAFSIGQFFEARLLAGKAFTLWAWLDSELTNSLFPRLPDFLLPSIGILLLAFLLHNFKVKKQNAFDSQIQFSNPEADKQD